MGVGVGVGVGLGLGVGVGVGVGFGGIGGSVGDCVGGVGFGAAAVGDGGIDCGAQHNTTSRVRTNMNIKLYFNCAS